MASGSGGLGPSLTHFHYDVDFVTGPQTPRERALATAVLEIERHVARQGWDGPVRLYSLVTTVEADRTDPGFAGELPDPGRVGPEHLTALEQGGLPDVDTLDALLAHVEWPDTVDGAAVVVEHVLDDGGGEVRLACGILRSGEQWCAVRMRAHDADSLVLSSADAVPGLVTGLRDTFR